MELSPSSSVCNMLESAIRAAWRTLRGIRRPGRCLAAASHSHNFHGQNALFPFLVYTNKSVVSLVVQSLYSLRVSELLCWL